MNEFSQHSNPQLQMRILDDELVWQNNSTMNSLVTFHRDYIIKQYERLVKEETEKLKVKGIFCRGSSI